MLSYSEQHSRQEKTDLYSFLGMSKMMCVSEIVCRCVCVRVERLLLCMHLNPLFVTLSAFEVSLVK